jgi:hypothetical protein
MHPFSCLLSMVIVVASSSILPGQQQSKTEDIEKEESNSALRRATRELSEWKIVLENEAHTTAICDKSSSLRWSWSDNGRLYGNVYVYSAKGRPVAIVEFFSWFTPIEGDYFQCTSLTSLPMAATRSGEEIWRPQSSSVEMHEMPKAPIPADMAALRLVQMKRLAESFEVDVQDKRGTGTTSTTRRLRLLSRPIYRFSGNNSDAVDGAIFAYVISTDPGAMLIIDAVRVDDKLRWRYGFARVWSYEASAKLGGQQVWEISEVDPRADPKANFYLNEIPTSSP